MSEGIEASFLFVLSYFIIKITKAITLYSLTHNVKEKRVGLPSSGHSKVSQKSYLHFIPITLWLDFVKPLLSFNFSILSKLKKTITSLLQSLKINLYLVLYKLGLSHRWALCSLCIFLA